MHVASIKLKFTFNKLIISHAARTRYLYYIARVLFSWALDTLRYKSHIFQATCSVNKVYTITDQWHFYPHSPSVLHLSSLLIVFHYLKSYCRIIPWPGNSVYNDQTFALFLGHFRQLLGLGAKNRTWQLLPIPFLNHNHPLNLFFITYKCEDNTVPKV